MLEVKKLCAGYAGKEILHDISLTVQAGQITAVLGPNGCGKSTLLKAICGILPVDSGQILLDSQELLALPRGTALRKAWRISHKTDQLRTARSDVWFCMDGFPT